MKRLPILLGLVLYLALLSCETGKKALQQGRYFDACYQAIERLRSSPDNKKAIASLKTAYPLAIEYTKREADRALSSSLPNRYVSIFNNYNELNKIAAGILKSPGALSVIPYPNYFNDELEKSRNLAAEELYSQAAVNMRRGTREAAKEAYLEYDQLTTILPNYKDVDKLINKAYWAALVKVVIEQTPISGAYKISGDFFQNQIQTYATQNIKNQFVRIFTPDEAEEMKLEPDQIIRIQFLDFVVGQTRESTNVIDCVSDTVVIGTTTDRRGQTVNVYGTVKARLFVNRREILSKGILDLQIVDFRTNTILSNKRFTGSFLWTDSWGSYNGDDRALTNAQLILCNRRSSPLPPPQDLFIEFTKPIYTQTVDYIQYFYKKY